MDKKYTRNPTDIKLCTSHQHFLFTVIVYSLTSIQEAREKRFQSFTGQLPCHSRRQRRQSNHSFVTEHIETTASASDHNIYEVSCPGWIYLSARFFMCTTFFTPSLTQPMYLPRWKVHPKALERKLCWPCNKLTFNAVHFDAKSSWWCLFVAW